MDDLTVCRLSAEALEYDVVVAEHFGVDHVHVARTNMAVRILWNPLAKAEQRWECVEWLLKANCTLALEPRTARMHELWGATKGDSLAFNCPASEFPARAVAELQRRKEK